MNNISRQEYDKAVEGLTQEILSNVDAWYDYVLHLPVRQQIAYTVLSFNSEIKEGGFNQYFSGSYGQLAYLTLKNLTLIRDMDTVEVFDDALHYINPENLPEEVFRKHLLCKKLAWFTDLSIVVYDYLYNVDNSYYYTMPHCTIQLLDEYLQDNP